ncbi:MAG: hypothetical protein K8F30_13230 [Taibaiella sp.]|nr:hypothetical protein [Taibaiella sp.]
MYNRNRFIAYITVLVPVYTVFTLAATVAYGGDNSIQSSTDGWRNLFILVLLLLSIAAFFLVIKYSNKKPLTQNKPVPGGRNAAHTGSKKPLHSGSNKHSKHKG